MLPSKNTYECKCDLVGRAHTVDTTEGRPNEQRLFDNLKAPIPNPAVTSHSLVDATQNLASKNSEMHKLALRPLRCFTTALTTSEEAALFPSFINFLTRLLSDPNIEALCDKSPDGAAAATAQSSTRHPEFDFTLDFFQPYVSVPDPSHRERIVVLWRESAQRAAAFVLLRLLLLLYTTAMETPMEPLLRESTTSVTFIMPVKIVCLSEGDDADVVYYCDRCDPCPVCSAPPAGIPPPSYRDAADTPALRVRHIPTTVPVSLPISIFLLELYF
ncbi:hypothetical protein C8R43DRAFT_1119096 [Mycena crocata]|nr:hypothetical protein C8R43DRAFT_1119096 [Mycena crocata]